ncbi:MAG: Hsp70 family protein, partial [Eggerthellaceae bacterium]|nr:Hsp70 family protein [Eggerthellaceae bacterium]
DYDEFAMQQFQDAAEKYKQQLTTRPEVRVSLNIAGLGLQTKLTRETFESLTTALLDETIQLTARTIENARSKGYEVSKILLVGGSTYMPQVQNALANNFPDLARELNEPNEAVSKGAALVARNDAIRLITEQNENKTDGGEGSVASEEGNGTGATQTPVISLPGAVDIENIATTTIKLATTKSYGIEVIANGEDMINNMIRKNQPMPSEGAYTHEQRFGTHAEGQSNVEVRIYENDEESELTGIDGREPIKEATFDLGGPMPAGSPIDVTFSLDTNGILDIVAVEPTSGRQCPIHIETSGLTAEQIEDIKSGLVMNIE